jgi:GTPase
MSSFIDHAEIEIRSGNGGPGCVSFRREKYVPRGGPDGGDGGVGGSVLFVADVNFRTLLDYKYKRTFSAENGSPGSSRNKQGRKGKDLIIPVPIGTLILDTSSQECIADLTEHGQTFCAAQGGMGGKGNAFFKSATRQAPKFAQPGEPGEGCSLTLELKLLADIGLVGLPNAGKSTLVSVISAAKPKIADYPFTTLIPHLGVVRRDKGRSFVVADIPGIIEDSHSGKGLGDRFLRHIERSAILLILVDISTHVEPSPQDVPDILINELDAYKEGMSIHVKAVVATKCDMPDTEENLRNLQQKAVEMGLPFIPISAITNKNLKLLLDFMENEYTKGKKQ